MQKKMFNLLVVLGLIMGCSGPKVFAPVRDSLPPPSTKVVRHVVAPGETLYSIAWRYNLNYKTLAKINSIGASYTIYPGQKLTLVAPKELAKSSAHRVLSVRSRPPVDKPSQAKSHTKVVVKKEPKRLIKKSKEVKKETVTKNGSKKLFWQWPVSGTVLRGFNAKNGLSKGIDIRGNFGEPVHAAAAGTIVYSGEGLRGYGKLIIIKHSEKFLSAYAHNSRLGAKEGDTVKAGDRIANMGSSGTGVVKLHFEIRFDGKPVDPLAYLPPKL